MKKFLVLMFVSCAFVFSYCGGEDGPGGSDRCHGQCITGQYCWNGICVDGCKSNETCAADQFCDIDDFTGDGHCQNKQASGCTSNSQCTGEQICKQGACVTPPEEQTTGCEWKTNMTDGCGDYEVCIQEEADAEGKPKPGDCYEMPACGETGNCPTEVAGAVCNEKADGSKIIGSKGRICLMGLCMADTDCPSKMKCEKFYSDIGGCMPEGMMGGCETDADCAEGEECEMGQCFPSMDW